jgi:single-stranded DNA-binding protein
MTISEGSFYVHGNLGRDWERKEITSKGRPTVIYSNSVAYQEQKDGPTTWVNLTVWPDRDGGELLGQTIAQTTSKGSRVITRGPIKFDSYVNKDGEQKGSWAQNVWGIGAEIRTPQTMSAAQVANEFPGATVSNKPPAVPVSHEPF